MWKVEEEDGGVVLDGGVVRARFARPPMSCCAAEDIGRLGALLAEWTERQAVVLAGGVPGRFIAHFEVDGILRKQVEPEGPITSPS
jgi:enoyl-CoA hydratase